MASSMNIASLLGTQALLRHWLAPGLLPAFGGVDAWQCFVPAACVGQAELPRLVLLLHRVLPVGMTAAYLRHGAWCAQGRGAVRTMDVVRHDQRGLFGCFWMRVAWIGASLLTMY